MPRVILRFKNRTIGDYPVEIEKPLTIGRRSDNEIVIDNLAVSGNHAKIFHHPKGFVLSDLDSKNGTFVKQKRVKNYLLKHKDVITIGKHILIYDNVGDAKFEPGKENPEASFAESHAADQTMFMDTERYRKMVGRTEPKSSDDGTPANVIFHSGAEGQLALTKSVTTIGRHNESDIVLNGFLAFFAGSTAATISRTSGNYHIRHISGFIKPKVNGIASKESVKLNEKDIVEIGSLRFSFFLSAPPND
ncbi:MAG: FHA domain-containing protein [Desulfobacteraceae bacterium]|nr:FHA domain-containing protein [Desulfobacteraceae bacterium]